MNLFDEPLLDADEERLLGRRIEAGIAADACLRGLLPRRIADEDLRRIADEGEAARHRFVLANLRLVGRLAAEESRRVGLPYEELFQEGVLGLLDAVQRWDYCRGLRFSTYAVIRIRKAVHEAALTRCGSLGLPPHAAATWLQIRRARDAAAGDVDGVASRLGLSPPTVRRWLAYNPPQQIPEDWIERPQQNEESPGVEAGAVAGPELRRRIAALPENLRGVVELRYGLCGTPRTVAEVAEQLGISPRHVRRLEQLALAQLRDDLPLEWAA